MRPSIWFHIHIPKTAGSTLRQILSRNFRKSYFSAVSLLEHHKVSLSQTREIIEKHHRWLRCYSDHRLSLDVPFDSKEFDVKALAFVRNPVSQVISQFNFQKNHQRRTTEAASMELEEFVEKKFNRPGRKSKGLQLQRLKGHEFGQDMQQIKELLDAGKLYLFPLEEFDLACACLEKRFPDEFASTAYIKSNQGKKTTQPEPGIFERIGELVKPDFELHSMSNWFLSTFADTVFDSPRQQSKHVKGLQKRCKSLVQSAVHA